MQVGFKRDYFLALPTSDLMGVRRAEAGYSDALSMSRALLLECEVSRVADSGDLRGPLVLDSHVLSYWTEHSERSNMPSWCASLGYTSEWTDLLGRWGSSGSDCYVRTHQSRVEKMQAEVASVVQAGSDLTDRFHEDEAAALLAKHLESKGVDPATISDQLDRFMCPQRGEPSQQEAHEVFAEVDVLDTDLFQCDLELGGGDDVLKQVQSTATEAVAPDTAISGTGEAEQASWLSSVRASARGDAVSFGVTGLL